MQQRRYDFRDNSTSNLLKTMPQKRRVYAPVWIALFSSATAVSRALGERILLKREWKLRPKDFVTAAIGAGVGYVLFRKRRGNKMKGLFTR